MEDQLSYEIFDKGRITKIKNLIEINSTNRMVAETDNYFAVVGYGAFLKGYFLIITKESIPSFGHIDKKNFDELKYFNDFLANYIKMQYKTDVVQFEHGMCACAGGLDHAHLHLMQFPKKIDKKLLIKIFNNVLKKRATGVQEIEFNNHKFTNVHDISNIILYDNTYKITKGKLLNNSEIDISTKYKNYPLSHNELINNNEQYIYLNCELNKFNFSTKHHLGTQFGRELVFDAHYETDTEFKEYMDQLYKSNRKNFVEMARFLFFRKYQEYNL